MSSATYDAKEKLEAALGIGLEAVKLAIRTDPTARLIWDHSVALIASLEQNPVATAILPKGVVDEETARRLIEAGFECGVDWSQGPYGNKGLPGNVTEAKAKAWDLFKHGVAPGPAEPLRDISAEVQAKTEACAHSFRYTGTDGHGSHKGEDHYRCVKCGVGEYRRD